MKLQIEKLEERIVVLEEKLEFQDYTVEKLNEALIAQQGQIDKLEHRLAFLQQKLESAQVDFEDKDTDQRPPHY